MKFVPVSPIHPDYQAFLDGLKSGALDRAGAVREATRLTGVTVHDVGNADTGELLFSLRSLVNRRLSKLPDREGCVPSTINHLVIGHAAGSGNNWFFLNQGGRVNDYVNSNVPAGEVAWVLACDDENGRSFSKLEGKEVISMGQQMDRPR